MVLKEMALSAMWDNLISQSWRLFFKDQVQNPSDDSGYCLITSSLVNSFSSFHLFPVVAIFSDT